MPRRSFLFRTGSALMLFLAFSLLVGCSGNPNQRVFGKITFNGQPLDRGTIAFMPLDLSKGSSGGATISKGVYDLPAERGLLPGKYKVTISSPDHIEKEEAAPGASGPPAKDRIPKRYNAESKEEIEVKAGAPNEFNYDIPAK